MEIKVLRKRIKEAGLKIALKLQQNSYGYHCTVLINGVSPSSVLIQEQYDNMHNEMRFLRLNTQGQITYQGEKVYGLRF